MYEIVFFAGGLGTRLRNTEDLPKPFVAINGISLISRIILSFYKTNIFSKFHVLTCSDNDIYSEILYKELPKLDIRIYSEPKRSGRSGALKFLIHQNQLLNKFFVANGDTLFSKLNAKEIIGGINSLKKDIPLTYLAKPDPYRDDYLAVAKTNGEKSKRYQNSGLFFVSRNWLENNVFIYDNLEDIDFYLYSPNNNVQNCFLNCNLFDAGTPERLSQIRSLII
tara:strand:- start:161 stop:829 length:669 start_codon:yes stop_codon:yes gene_type:complete